MDLVVPFYKKLFVLKLLRTVIKHKSMRADFCPELIILRFLSSAYL